ncbi:MAG TPA: TIGR03667 family PPOX class F420-dependent oxidoreductase [Thermomicrobiales bacterium]|nr:TIGR03667 family PPOX class F420-dependent oxidoreductase [Thermomicrobiales bacterium]
MASVDLSFELSGKVLDRLRSEQVIWFTTVSGTGAPQPSPVWFLWQDDSVLIFSQPDTPKVRAIRHNPRVALSFNSNADGGDVAVFSGVATLDDGELRADEIPAYIEKYSDGLVSLGMSPAAFADEYRQAIVVRPTGLRSW